VPRFVVPIFTEVKRHGPAVIRLLLGIVVSAVVLVFCFNFAPVGYVVAILIAWPLAIAPALDLMDRATSLAWRSFCVGIYAVAIPILAVAALAGPSEILTSDFRTLHSIYFLCGAIAALARGLRGRRLLVFTSPLPKIYELVDQFRVRWRTQKQSDELAYAESLKTKTKIIETPLPRSSRNADIENDSEQATTPIWRRILGLLTVLLATTSIVTGALALYMLPLTSKGTGFAWIPLIILGSACGVSLVLALLSWFVSAR
jgi:hypothetical protein